MDKKMYDATRVVVDRVKFNVKYAKGSVVDKAIRFLEGEMIDYVNDHPHMNGSKHGFRWWWPVEAVAAAKEEYSEGLGTKHPERLITVEEFEQRIKEFEAVVGEWMDNDKKWARSTLARRWGKAVGIASHDSVYMFQRMWEIVDSRFSIS